MLPKYLDTNNTGTITVYVLICCDAGQIDKVDDLYYIVHSKEAGCHNEAHIHAHDKCCQNDASVRISDGNVIEGRLSPKLTKKAKKRILENQEFFYNCRNTMTDGLRVDISHHFGNVPY